MNTGKSASVAVPPLSLGKTFTSVSVAWSMSSLVMVQVLVSPRAIVPEQSADSDLE